MILFVGLTVAAWLVIWPGLSSGRGCPSRNSSTRSAARSSDWSTSGCSSASSWSMLDSFFLDGGEGPGWLTAYYDGLNGSADHRLLPRHRHPDRRHRPAALRSRRDRRAPLMTGATAEPALALEAAWFDRPAASLAIDLLGSRLVHDAPEGSVGGRIVEVEAYRGPEDLAAHSVARSDAAELGHVRTARPPLRLPDLRPPSLPERRRRTRDEARGRPHPRPGSRRGDRARAPATRRRRSRISGWHPGPATSVERSASTGA